MSIAYFTELPQGAVPNKPVWHEGKCLIYRYVARDPLTSRAYFDAHDVTFVSETLKAFKERIKPRPDWRFVELAVHDDVMKIKAHQAYTGMTVGEKGATGEKRGKVVGFSRASRKRMIEYMAKTRVRGQLLFSTFTYPDEFPIVYHWNNHFEALRRRIERRYPDYSIIWRKELKERKSGKSKGKIAPHWHMVVDTGVEGTPDITVEKYMSYGKLEDKTTSALSREFETWVREQWFEIVGSKDEKHREHGNFTVACRNKRHAYKYVSKYVAKEENDEYLVGRRWGRIGQWDTSASENLFLTKKEYIELMRLVVRWMKSNGNDYGKQLAKANRNVGAALFGIGDASRCPDLFKQLLNHASQLAGELPPFG